MRLILPLLAARDCQQMSAPFPEHLGIFPYFSQMWFIFCSFTRGGVTMSLLPFAECARQLGVHPKTLRTYVKRAQMSLTPHPTDARIKCLTEEQMQRLATLFGRSATSPALQAPETQAKALPARVSCPEADLLTRLSMMEQQVRTLSEQVAALALALLAERERTVEHRLSVLERTLHELREPTGGSPSHPEPEGATHEDLRTRSPRSPYPAEQRARSRMPVLIEYSSKQGCYIIVSSPDGELPITPDSPEWFDLLAARCSFRFVGQSGRFTAYRESRRGSRTRSWTAHRSIHQQHYKHHIGVTDRLTIAWLEQVAAKFQEDTTSL